MTDPLPTGPNVATVAFAGGAALVERDRGRVHLCNESSAAMWRLLAQGLSEPEVALALAERYAVPHERIAGDLKVALANWRQAGLMGPGGGGPAAGDAPADPPRGGEPQTGTYNLAGFSFQLGGAEERIIDHLAATLRPFRTNGAKSPCRLEIRTDSSPEPFVLLEGEAERLRTATTAEMIGGVLQFLLQRVHPASQWLALIHAAAVRAPDGRAILLAGDGGSGKSTLAAWLSRRGFGFLADDMAVLDTDGRAVPWPLAHSIKRGSWAALAPAFPELDGTASQIVNGREIKVLAAPAEAWRAPPAPVGALVFPSYDANAEPALSRLSMLETVQRLFGGRLWLGERLTRDRVQAFIDWLEPVPAYAVRYSSLEEAEALLRSALD